MYLTSACSKRLKAIPRRLGTEFVLVNPETGTRCGEGRKLFKRAFKNLGLYHVWFHDLRRSFVTNARAAARCRSR